MTCGGIRREQRRRSRRSSSGSSQSIHMPRRIDCSVWRAAYVSTRCLHRLTNSAIPNASISRLRGEPEVALDIDLDPQALAVEAVLVALVLAEHRVEALVEVLVRPAPGVVDGHRVVGRDRTVEEAPFGTAGVLCTQPREGPTVAPPLEDLVFLGDEVGLRTDGSEHSASGLGRTWAPGSGRRGARIGGRLYPTRDARS